ncbi:MAG: hypothetical protein LC792_05560 [Actinobacteria bacterium]|nr:hypothetical protein [Actinomycetota bacterium]
MGERRGTTLRGPRLLGVMALLSAVISGVGFAALSPLAQSTPDNLNAFNQRYGTTGTKLDSCLTCHESQAAAKENLNPYGKDLDAAKVDFGAIESKDSDGDGVSNIDEIHKRTFPGNRSDK